MFYKTGVDIASVKSMWHFLKNHFTYSTMNSWNGQRSIANNVKVYNLKLDGDWGVALKYLFDEEDSGLLQLYINDEIRFFEEDNPYYRVGFNGRSNGYLVLYNKDNYLSVLPDCVTDFDTYEDFKEDCNTWGYKVVHYLRELRDAVEIVRAFDKLCDSIRDLVNEYSLKSFDTDKLEAAVERFNEYYCSDLKKLGLVGPEINEGMTGGVVRLNDIREYQAFMHCFLELLGEPQHRIATNKAGTILWLKED